MIFECPFRPNRINPTSHNCERCRTLLGLIKKYIEGII